MRVTRENLSACKAFVDFWDIATLLGATCCVRLATMLRRVATCCSTWGVVGSNLKMVNFFMQHLWMLHDVVVVWPGSSNNVAPGHAQLFDFQFAACRSTLQQGGQTRATCCAQMLWSFGRSLHANAGPTILRYVALRCCYRLAGA